MAIEKFGYDGVVKLPRERVWNALQDPAVLIRCVSGCTRLDPDTNNRFRYAGHYKVGPFSREFKGTVTMTDIAPQTSFRFFRGSHKPFEGDGAFAGQVVLADHPDGTRLVVNADVEVSKTIRTIVNLLRPKKSDSPLKTFVEAFERAAAAP